jgi:ABC-type glutathione transport system ATPase component
MMDDGRIVEQGSRDDIFDRAAHPRHALPARRHAGTRTAGAGFWLMRRRFAGG